MRNPCASCLPSVGSKSPSREHASTSGDCAVPTTRDKRLPVWGQRAGAGPEVGMVSREQSEPGRESGRDPEGVHSSRSHGASFYRQHWLEVPGKISVCLHWSHPLLLAERMLGFDALCCIISNGLLMFCRLFVYPWININRV